tara:strand:+ start:279 stop:659 length:381 start_codon:yes stop_codon:yes gene_type:complete
MAIPYESLSNLPQGFPNTATVPGMGACIVQGVSGNAFSNRVVSRTDGQGDRSDFAIRKSSEPIEVTLTVQRADTSVGIPTEGNLFTYDYTKSGTAADLIVKDSTVNIDPDSFDTVDVVCVVKDATA